MNKKVESALFVSIDGEYQQLFSSEQVIEKLQQENQQLKEDLKQVLDDVLKAFENNNCIDWNFTEIREKYNFDLLKGDKK